MSSVLIVGNLSDDKWIGALIRHVKSLEPSLQIDFFWDSYPTKESSAGELCEHIFYTSRHFPSFIYKIPKVRVAFIDADVRMSFEEFLNDRINNGFVYDVVNFHYLNNATLSCWKKVLAISRKTLLAPWGSDVLRRSTLYIKKMASYASHYDRIITSDNPRFQKQIIKLLRLTKKQLLPLGFGITAIDQINSYSSVSREAAKKQLGIENQYVITCGYNSSPAQNHIKIIDAIDKVRNKLPHNTILVFPMTYGGKEQVFEVKKKLELTGLNGIIYDYYLSTEQVVYLRKCSDMFIHAQDTDANSASLSEYILCGATVINASWLKYEQYEKYGQPFYSFDDFEHLPAIITEAYKGGSLVSEEMTDFITRYGWAYKAPQWVDAYNGIF